MKFQQQPHTLLMIRPKHFGYNHETASSNSFQQPLAGSNALQEFDKMVDVLRSHDIDVTVFDDTDGPVKPDAIFPNNWISFHQSGEVVLYPMLAQNRRWERRTDIIEHLKNSFRVTSVLDLTAEEANGRFLEGTGSIVFDHPNNIAYACRSPRTDENLFRSFCESIHYQPIIFDAVDRNGSPIYHTNVVLSIGEKYALICLDAITSDHDQETLLQSFAQTNLQVIAISYDQMMRFAGNAIEVKTRSGENLLLMSQTAWTALVPGQVNALTKYVEVLPLSIPSIEQIGGGSVRCMVAGIHLPRK